MKLQLDSPLVIAEIGINHNGNIDRAIRMIRAARIAGCKCVKFQCHVIDDEYSQEGKDIIPPNATESIYNIMARCAFSEEQDRELKELVESLGMIYLSTPFSRAAADRLERLGVTMYKIGSGECTNIPLLKHVAGFGKPVILSTGMSSMSDIQDAVQIFSGVPLALLHCTSEYPTPYEHIRLGAMEQLDSLFGYCATIGLSDHSMGIYTCLAAVALGARVVEKHFTISRSWPGPDNPISIEPPELRDLVCGADAIYRARGGNKIVLDGERAVAAFANASVTSVASIMKDELLTRDNVWVRRPAGGIPAREYERVIGTRARDDIPPDIQITWDMLE